MLPVAREFHDQELIVVSSVFLGQVSVFRGQANTALALLEPVAAAMERSFGADIETMRAYLYLAQALGMNGRCVAARRLVDHVRPWEAEARQPVYSGVFYVTASAALVVSGDAPAALAAAERAVIIAEELKEPHLRYLAWDQSAASLARLGDHDLAREHRARALALRHQYGGGACQDIYEAVEAESHLAAGRVEAALELAEQRATASRPAGLMFSLVTAERVWGCARALLGAAPAEVDAHLRESRDVAVSTGQVMEAIRTELEWASVLRARGDDGEAEAHVRGAQALMTDELVPFARDEFLAKIRQVRAR